MCFFQKSTNKKDYPINKLAATAACKLLLATALGDSHIKYSLFNYHHSGTKAILLERSVL